MCYWTKLKSKVAQTLEHQDWFWKYEAFIKYIKLPFFRLSAEQMKLISLVAPQPLDTHACKNTPLLFMVANNLHFPLFLQVSWQGRRYERTFPMSLECCQLLRLQVLHQWNVTMDNFCPIKTHSLCSSSLSLPSPGPKEPPQRLWTPQPVPCTGHLWGQGMVLCMVGMKGSDLSWKPSLSTCSKAKLLLKWQLSVAQEQTAVFTPQRSVKNSSASTKLTV